MTGDSGGAVGPDGAFNINVLGQPDINIAGNPGTNTLQATDLTKFTPYVVDGALTAGTEVAYSTIQAALDAITTDGATDALVYIRPGTYTEDLTLPAANVTLSGDPGGLATIAGTHTPDASNNLNFFGLILSDATAILSSAAAGSGGLTFFNCFMIITNGYAVNVPNWTGQISFDNCGEASTEDGAVFNTGGSFLKMINTEMGAGTTNPLTSSGGGLARFDTCNVNCPMSMAGTGTFIFQNGCKFAGNVTIGGSQSGTAVHTAFLTDTQIALSYDSSGDSTFSNCTIDSSNSLAIGGSGSGALTLKNVNFTQGAQIEDSVNTPNLFHVVDGQGQTVNTGTADLITYTLRNVATAYQIRVQVSGITAGGAVVIGTQELSLKTDGATPTIVGSCDDQLDKDLLVSGASVTFVLSGNDLIVRATGSLGTVIDWNVRMEFLMRNV